MAATVVQPGEGKQRVSFGPKSGSCSYEPLPGDPTFGHTLTPGLAGSLLQFAQPGPDLVACTSASGRSQVTYTLTPVRRTAGSCEALVNHEAAGALERTKNERATASNTGTARSPGIRGRHLLAARKDRKAPGRRRPLGAGGPNHRLIGGQTSHSADRGSSHKPSHCQIQRRLLHTKRRTSLWEEGKAPQQSPSGHGNTCPAPLCKMRTTRRSQPPNLAQRRHVGSGLGRTIERSPKTRQLLVDNLHREWEGLLHCSLR